MTGRVNVNLPYPKSELGWRSDSSSISQNAILNGKIIVGDNTIVESRTRFFGSSIIGNNCIIKEGAQIRNSIIWDNVIIEKNAKLDGCIVASNTKIGMNAIVGPGNIIPDGNIIPSQEKLLAGAKL